MYSSYGVEDAAVAGGLGAFFAVLGIVLIPILLISIGIYIWSSIVTAKTLRLLDYDKAWLAWLPIGREIALASAVHDTNGCLDFFGKDLNYWLFALYPIIAAVVSAIPIIGWLASIAVSILLGGTIYCHVYAYVEDKSFSDTRALGLVSGLFGIIPLIKFTCYKKQ